MSTRPQLSPFSIIANGNMSGTLISTATIIQKLSFVSIGCIWTGTPNGTFFVEVSNDYSVDPSGNVMNAGTWNAVPLSVATVAVGTADYGFIDLDGIGAYAIRLRYVPSSSTGVLNAMIAGKAA